MMEAPRGFGFALKTRDHFGRVVAFELVAADGFQRDRALYARVERFVNAAHRAAPEFAQDFVLAELEWGFAHGFMRCEKGGAGACSLVLAVDFPHRFLDQALDHGIE